RGEEETPILLESFEYDSHSEGGITVHPLSKHIVYRNDDDSGEIETTHDYEFHEDTVRIQRKTTTLPVVPENQNGNDVAATQKEVQNIFGRVTWSMDQRGFIIHQVYDVI